MNNKKEITYIDYQELLSLISIITTIISITLLENQKRILSHKKPIFKSKKARNISLFNRTLLVIISLLFLYINHRLKEISKEKGENLTPYNLQIIASILTISASIIALYVVTIPNENIRDIENPII